jgi:hypothetical protein
MSGLSALGRKRAAMTVEMIAGPSEKVLTLLRQATELARRKPGRSDHLATANQAIAAPMPFLRPDGTGQIITLWRNVGIASSRDSPTAKPRGRFTSVTGPCCGRR